MTLSQILTNKELYSNKSMLNYELNTKIINQLKIDKNSDINLILNKTIKDLFLEYVNSDEFHIK